MADPTLRSLLTTALESGEPGDVVFMCGMMLVEIERLRDALEKCAEPHRWHAPCTACGPTIVETGCYIARRALETGSTKAMLDRAFGLPPRAR